MSVLSRGRGVLARGRRVLAAEEVTGMISRISARPTASRSYKSGSFLTTMASLIAILDLKGKPLIQRSYRDDVPPSYVERFLPLILDIEEEGQQITPCFTNQGINYMHIRHSNLYRKFI